MATYRTEQSQWRELLKPLVLGLVALAGAATVYLKNHTELSDAHDASVAASAVQAQKIEVLESRVGKLERDSEVLKGAIYEMKSDVSFIRGKIEGRK